MTIKLPVPVLHRGVLCLRQQRLNLREHALEAILLGLEAKLLLDSHRDPVHHPNNSHRLLADVQGDSRSNEGRGAQPADPAGAMIMGDV